MTSTASAQAGVNIHRSIGRHVDKEFDWNAFPRSESYPRLQRGQMRYVGAGGSPKIDDPSTLPPDHFTLSMINLPPGHYGASHYHDDCEEVFLGLDGLVTVGMTWDDVVLETFLGPKDLMLLPIGRPHAYRTDTLEPSRLSIMVGNKRPHPPIYVAHPNQTEHSATFGALPGKTQKYSPLSTDPRHLEFGKYLVRYNELPVHWNEAGFGWKEYVGGDALPAAGFRENLIHLSRGQGVQLYQRAVEDVYLVLEGVVTVGWEVDGRIQEASLGPKDVVFNPAGRAHYFRNDGFHDAQFMMVVGTAEREDVKFSPYR
jgi:mannose-6-phosphate isomerase-like protein (cupin superfamily)